jgi:hypothetical protein
MTAEDFFGTDVQIRYTFALDPLVRFANAADLALIERNLASRTRITVTKSSRRGGSG